MLQLGLNWNTVFPMFSSEFIHCSHWLLYWRLASISLVSASVYFPKCFPLRSFVCVFPSFVPFLATTSKRKQLPYRTTLQSLINSISNNEDEPDEPATRTIFTRDRTRWRARYLAPYTLAWMKVKNTTVSASMTLNILLKVNQSADLFDIREYRRVVLRATK